jgi:hypothetical protein
MSTESFHKQHVIVEHPPFVTVSTFWHDENKVKASSSILFFSCEQDAIRFMRNYSYEQVGIWTGWTIENIHLFQGLRINTGIQKLSSTRTADIKPIAM